MGKLSYEKTEKKVETYLKTSSKMIK